MSIHPPKIITDLIPSDLGLKYEEVSFKSADGIKLSGWLMPNNKTKAAIIVMHGYPADKANLLPTAEFLSKDFNVFLKYKKIVIKYKNINYRGANKII